MEIAKYPQSRTLSPFTVTRYKNSQVHILQHTPGPFTFLIIFGFSCLYDGLNDTVADAIVFEIDDILSVDIADRLCFPAIDDGLAVAQK